MALVIGNGDYRKVGHLDNATNDARLIAATLRKLNFTLAGGDAQLDLERARMAQMVEQFGRMLAGAEVGLFYYSGHGLQVQGVNWLVPVDANPSRPQDLDFQMIDADLVLRQMDGAGTKLNLVLLDACRNNPFVISGVRAVQGGLAEMRAPEGTLISYATQPGNVATDGDGVDSPYTMALAESMQQPGVDIFRLFNQVGLKVKRSTAGSQQPWVSTSPIDGEFYFAGALPPAEPAHLPAPAPPSALPALTRESAGPDTAAAKASPPVQVAELVRPPELPAPAVSLDRLSTIARARPCSILEVRVAGDHVTLSGLAWKGQDWDGFLKQMKTGQDIQAGARDVEFLPAFACGPVDALAAWVRATGDAVPRRLITLRQRDVAVGNALTLTLRGAAEKIITLDLFRAGDMVEHIKVKPVRSDGDDVRVTIEHPSGSVPGSRLLTALISSAPPDLGARSPAERASVYLEALGKSLQTMTDVRADLATYELRPAVPRASVAATAAVPPSRCGAILEQAQLGEALSDGDRAYLRTHCR